MSGPPSKFVVVHEELYVKVTTKYREIGIDCNKTSVRLRPLTMKPVAPRRAGAQLRRDADGRNM